VADRGRISTDEVTQAEDVPGNRRREAKRDDSDAGDESPAHRACLGRALWLMCASSQLQALGTRAESANPRATDRSFVNNSILVNDG
jgi:hypothetical protein